LGVSVAIEDDPPKFLKEEEFLEWSKTIAWGEATIIAHNCRFDATVLTQRYHITPCRYACTQFMANAMLPIKSRSLKAVAEALNLGAKGNALVEGSHAVTKELEVYANQDLHLCREIYKVLWPFFPDKEMDLIDLTVRMAVEPELVVNRPLLECVRNEEITNRVRYIMDSGYRETQLTSNPQFAEILKTLEVPIPTKISNATGEETEAFSKGDDEFVSLMLDYPQHKKLWNARLAAKSNINIKRPEKLLKVTECTGGLLPVPYNYYGAHTGRYTGTDYNLQNLPHKNKSRLRECIRAPKGYKLAVVDSSQIELRINMWLADQQDMLELLRQGGDIYKAEAAEQFNVGYDEVTSEQRQFGKIVMLGCGYGLGWTRFRRYCAAGPLGMDPIYLSDEEAMKSIRSYRITNYKIPENWRRFDDFLTGMMYKNNENEYKCLKFGYEVIQLPNGMYLQYSNLRHTEEGGMIYDAPKSTKFIWGGVAVENVVQALARIVNMYQMLEIDRLFRVVGTVHDEVWALVPNGADLEAEEYMKKCMSTPPDWAPDLPVSSDFNIAEHYCK
jgi:DNA polymerase III epsilon subunit-like protein